MHGEGGTRTSQQQRLYACLRTAILSGQIEEGTRLAPSRTLAEELGIARNSVLYAYEQLAAEGFVLSRRQGTVVARVGLQQTPTPAPEAAPELSRRVKDLERPRGGMDDLLPFLPGTPALDEFPLAQWRRCMERGWRRIGPGQMGYGPVEGNVALRQAVAEYLRVSRGVRCDATQVFITDGTQNSLDMCARTLADAGDTAWIENPGYYGARAALQAADMRLMPISVDVDGLAPREEDWRDTPPRLIYITPSHQYPLGAVMSLERRLSLIQHARAAGAWIIEDDYDSEFRHTGAPLSAVQGLTENAPVIYLGTFSKMLFPALRLGYMVVPPALVPALKKTAGALMLRGAWLSSWRWPSSSRQDISRGTLGACVASMASAAMRCRPRSSATLMASSPYRAARAACIFPPGSTPRCPTPKSAAPPVRTEWCCGRCRASACRAR